MARSILLGPSDLGTEQDRLVQIKGHVDQPDGADWQGSIPKLLKEAKANASLLWQRYLPAHDEPRQGRTELGVDFSDVPNPKKMDARAKDWRTRGVLSWFVYTAHEMVDTEMLAAVHKRRAETHTGATRWLRLRNRWRAAIGLGRATIIENSGAAMHHTYGFPILPGDSLKGLCAHFLKEEQEAPESELEEIFGIGGDAGQEGAIVFGDGWPETTPWWDVDVVTPHHPEYEEATARIPAADDRENPEPHQFLTVAPGVVFRIPLSLTRRGRSLPATQQEALLARAENALTDAAAQWGVGAKTGAGYGRMERDFE